MEQEARYAIMHRVANNKERVKFEDLFARPDDSYITQVRGQAFEGEVEKAMSAQDFIQRLQFEE